MSHRLAPVLVIALGAFVSTVAVGAPTIPDDFTVTLGRTTCLGECPAYSVSIDARGNVKYEGRKFVRVEGLQIDRIPVARVAALAAQVDRIRLFELDDRYDTMVAPGGGRISITDRPRTFVSVTRGRTFQEHPGLSRCA